MAIVALIVNTPVAIASALLYERAQRLPHIHDISTDTADPPKFIAVLPLRAGARTPSITGRRPRSSADVATPTSRH